jgi:translation initiation factor IF-3
MIGQGDMDVKFKKIREFIEDGDKVKIMIRFRGREMAHKDNGFAICDKILSSIENSEWETKPSFAGNRLLGVLKRASK